MEANTLFLQGHPYPGSMFPVIRMENGAGKTAARALKKGTEKTVKRMSWEEFKPLKQKAKILSAKTGGSADTDTAAKASRSRAAQIIAEAFGRMERAIFGDGEQ